MSDLPQSPGLFPAGLPRGASASAGVRCAGPGVLVRRVPGLPVRPGQPPPGGPGSIWNSLQDAGGRAAGSLLGPGRQGRWVCFQLLARLTWGGRSICCHQGDLGVGAGRPRPGGQQAVSVSQEACCYRALFDTGAQSARRRWSRGWGHAGRCRGLLGSFAEQRLGLRKALRTGHSGLHGAARRPGQASKV